MAWLTEQQFRDLRISESATDIPSPQIVRCLEAAIEKIARMCGDGIIEEIGTGDDGIRKVKSFRRAQELFAYAQLLPVVSQRFKSGGIQIKEIDQNSSSTNEYAKFSEVEAARKSLEKDAADEIEIYLTPEEVKRENEMPFVGSFSVKKNIVW